jgi:hypothetical protein
LNGKWQTQRYCGTAGTVGTGWESREAILWYCRNCWKRIGIERGDTVVLQELLEEDRNRERRYCGTAGTIGRG